MSLVIYHKITWLRYKLDFFTKWIHVLIWWLHSSLNQFRQLLYTVLVLREVSTSKMIHLHAFKETTCCTSSGRANTTSAQNSLTKFALLSWLISSSIAKRESKLVSEEERKLDSWSYTNITMQASCCSHATPFLLLC